MSHPHVCKSFITLQWLRLGGKNIRIGDILQGHNIEALMRMIFVQQLGSEDLASCICQDHVHDSLGHPLDC